jgi:cytochrome b6-f complex iron-sulfur subunit
MRLAGGAAILGALGACGSEAPLPPTVAVPTDGIDVGPLADLLPGTVVRLPEHRLAVLADETGVWALSLLCTHRQALLDHDPVKKAFTCPLHGAMFDHAGAVLQKPATSPLAWYRVRLVGGQVLVDPAVEVPAGTRTPRS